MMKNLQTARLPIAFLSLVLSSSLAYPKPHSISDLEWASSDQRKSSSRRRLRRGQGNSRITNGCISISNGCANGARKTTYLSRKMA